MLELFLHWREDKMFFSIGQLYSNLAIWFGKQFLTHFVVLYFQTILLTSLLPFQWWTFCGSFIRGKWLATLHGLHNHFPGWNYNLICALCRIVNGSYSHQHYNRLVYNFIPLSFYLYQVCMVESNNLTSLRFIYNSTFGS